MCLSLGTKAGVNVSASTSGSGSGEHNKRRVTTTAKISVSPPAIVVLIVECFHILAEIWRSLYSVQW